MARIAGRHRGGRALVLDEPHDRAHGDRRRTRPRHLRRRGRALRHRSGARRARPACSSPPRGRAGEDLAAPDREMAWMRKLGGDRATGHLCADAERSRPGRGAACSICPRKPRPKAWRCGRGRGPSRHAAARAPDVPSVRPLPVVGRGQRRDARREGGSHAGPGAPPPAARRGRRAIEPMRQFLDPDRAFPMSAHRTTNPAGRRASRASSRGAPGTDGGVLRRPHGRRRHVARPATVAELHRVLTRRRAHRCSSTRRARGSATVARTAAPRATRARRRSC